jgi:hypothetical protein
VPKCEISILNFLPSEHGEETKSPRRAEENFNQQTDTSS